MDGCDDGCDDGSSNTIHTNLGQVKLEGQTLYSNTIKFKH